MQFSCYACGLKFSDGLPPIEALSIQQLGAVGERPTIQHDLLFGTKWEGLSTANFCAFCITVIRDFPLAMECKNDTPGHHMVIDNTGVDCECGLSVSTSRQPPMRPTPIMDYVRANREMNMHMISVLYADADTTELNNLIQKEI